MYTYMPGNRMSSLFQLKKTLVCRQKKICSPTWIHFHILCIIREICIDTHIYIYTSHKYLFTVLICADTPPPSSRNSGK